MPGLTDNLEHYLPPSEDAIRNAVVDGLVVIDTNVLLEGYRFNPTARRELFSVLERIGDRLWIPHQVALEFMRNRLDVMLGLDSTYNEAIADVENFKRRAEQELANKIRNLANRVAMPDAERDRIIDLITGSLKEATAVLRQLQASHGGDLATPTSDLVLDDLKSILSGKVGSPPTREEVDRLKQHFSERLKLGIPPGNRDILKEDSSGDYIIWWSAIQESKKRNLPLLFITSEVKDDWFLKVKGRTVSARPELIEEAWREARVRAIVAQTRSLLIYAQKHLHAPVSEETLRQAKPPQSLRSRVFQALTDNAPKGDQLDLTELLELADSILHLSEIDRISAQSYVRAWKQQAESRNSVHLGSTLRGPSLRKRVHQTLDANVPIDDERDLTQLLELVDSILHLNDVDRISAQSYVRSWKQDADARLAAVRDTDAQD